MFIIENERIKDKQKEFEILMYRPQIMFLSETETNRTFSVRFD